MSKATYTDCPALSVPSPEIAAYEATPEFQTYLDSKAKWEAAHAAYGISVNPVTHNALVIAEQRMRVDLRYCRETSEHLAAFGW